MVSMLLTLVAIGISIIRKGVSSPYVDFSERSPNGQSGLLFGERNTPGYVL